ncbi:hypothetical protein SHKM778_84160 [Streptomyces sp. KM77-8]|uniref:non-specific serine/threonine protein kinase n=1 Tax=Streptomyces haneummycinicus TaxID=3074435 RepID=A0AAT9HWY7_9ACTN
MARRIGSRYTAHQILGRGSAGTVWLGDGPEGPVAVKLLREDLSSDQELVGRFVQERTALLGLEHPHVVSVRDLVVDGNDLALVMDLVRGTDLRTRLDRERRLAPEAAVAIVADVADGLAAAHAAGVVHRDVKPENVLLDMQGPLGPGGSHRALLTDFGVAKLIDTPRRTRATKIIGTPDYLAPEIVEGLPRARRSTSTRWPRSCTSCSPASRRSAAATRARYCAAMSPRRSSPPGHPGRAVAAAGAVPGEGPRVPAARLRAGRPAAGAAADAGGDAPAGRGRAGHRVRGGHGRRPPPALRHRPGRRGTGTPPGRGPPGPGRQTGRLQPRHAYVDEGPDPRRTGRRSPRHSPRPRTTGARRPGSARNRAITRRRRLTVAVAAALVLAAAAGTWLATADDETPPPQDTRNSAPGTP